MIIIYILQLLIGSMIVLGIFGQILNTIQKVLKIENNALLIFFLSILTIFFYGMIAYYYSVSIDIYCLKHKGKLFTTIISFLLLTFMLNGPAKYAGTAKERNLIIISGSFGSIFFILIRFIPSIGELVYSWLPVVIWT